MKRIVTMVVACAFAIGTTVYTERQARAGLGMAVSAVAALAVGAAIATAVFPNGVPLLTGPGRATTSGAEAALQEMATAGVLSRDRPGVEVPINPQTPLPTPPGWTQPAPGSVEPTPPATAAVTGQASSYPATQTVTARPQNWIVAACSYVAFPSAAAACTNAWTNGGCGGMTTSGWSLAVDASNNCKWTRASDGAKDTFGTATYSWGGCLAGSSISPDGTKCLGAYTCPNGGTLSGSTCSLPPTCPTGYTASGSSCVLADVGAVKKPTDGICGVKRIGNTFAADANDPDCGTFGPGAGAAPDGTNVVQPSPNKIVISNPATGLQGTITLNPDGSTSMTLAGNSEQMGAALTGSSATSSSTSTSTSSATTATTSTSNATTTTRTVNVSAPAADGTTTVTGVAQQTTQGTGTAATTTQAFPDDYARQATAVAIQANTAATTEQLKSIKEKFDDAAMADPILPTWSDPWGSTFTALKGWTVPNHSSTCPTPSFSINLWSWQRTYTIDSHCQLVADHFGVLQTVMAVVWTVAALFIVLRA